MKPFIPTFSLFCLVTSTAFALNTPTGGSALPAGPATIGLHWIDRATDETGFEVQRSANGSGSWVTVADETDLPTDSTHFYDRGLEEQTTYYYRVRAVDESTSSNWLNLGSATTTIKMNVIFFLADDMGYKDIVALRNPDIDGPTIHETPALDLFVDEALTIDNAYCSGPRCVVARRSIQTGKYDWRPEAIPNNAYYVDYTGSPKGGGLWAGGTTVDGSNAGPGVEIPFDNVTYGEAVKDGGYRTCFIGKYHLGESEPYLHTPTGYSFGDQPSRGPRHQGYDVSIAAGHAGAPPASYFALLNQNPGAGGAYTFELPDLDDTSYMLNPAAPAEDDYVTDRLTDKAIGFMDDAITNFSSQPFHLTLAHYAVHTPAEAKPTYVDYYQTKKEGMAAEFAAHPAGSSALITDYSVKTRVWQDNAVYAAMMQSYDESFAALRSYLATTDDPRYPGKKLSETTVIVVSSDHGGKSTTPLADDKSIEDDENDAINPDPTFDEANGSYKSGTPNAYSSYPTSNYPFRQGKTWVYEGGLKVPLLIYYPGLTQPGARSDAFIHHADLFASFVDMAGAPQQPNESTDSISFMLTAADPDLAARDEMHHFFTNANKGTGNPAIAAYRKGDYKLLYFIVQRKVELYNLAADIYERNDLSASRPDLAAEMLHEIYQQALSTGMNMPKPGSNSWTSEQNDVLLRNGVIAELPATPDAAPTWDGSGYTTLSSTALELNWVVNATNATHSVIYRRADAEGETSYREHAFVPVGTTTFRDTNLVSGGQYRYRIESENLGGWYEPSSGDSHTGNKSITLPGSGILAVSAVDDTVTTVPGELRIINPLLNDEGEGALTITSITQPTLGSAEIIGGKIHYAAPDAFAGDVTMTYTVKDSADQTATATITIDLPTSESYSAVERWDFVGASSTDGLKDLTNLGSWNSVWNSNTTAQGDLADGSGKFVLVGDSGTLTRKLPGSGSANADPADHYYATPVTTGKFRVEVSFASWSVAAASNGDSWSFGANDTNGDRVGRLSFRVTDSGTEIQFSGFDGNYRTVAYGYERTEPLTVAVEFDFDNDTIDYLVDDAVTESFSFTGNNIGQLIYSKGGAWGTTDTTIVLEEMQLIEALADTSLYDAYAAAYPWNGVKETGPDDSPAGDGLTNFFKFAFGLDPLTPSPGNVTWLASNGGGLDLRFTPARNTDEVTYTVERSTDLLDWETEPPVVVDTPAGQEVSVSLPGDQKGFGRVRPSS